MVVRGRVQGVFFRAETSQRASSLGLGGWVRNNPDGTVEAVFEGHRDRVDSMVGASGYVVNLAVFSALVVGTDMHHIPAATISFLVAVTNNYTWNRLWTFRGQRGHVGYQGLRFFVVSLLALGANELLLTAFVAAGMGKVVAQAIAIVLVTPINFVGNKLWSFRRR